MNVDDDTSDDAGKAETSRGSLCGERLVEARRARQIPVTEIAKELHLDEHKIRALESNDFDVIGAPVFVKGHLRKYAQLVGVDADEVLAEYDKMNRSPGIQPVILSRPKPSREFSPGPWVAVIVVILIAAIVYWILVARPFEGLLPPGLQPDTGSVEPPVPASVSSEREQAASEAESAVDEPAGEEPVRDTQAAEPDEVQSLPEPQRQEPAQVTVESETPPPPVAEGEVRLSVTFSGDCWTEISDATGRRLYFNLGRSGATIEVAGQAPLSVLFGNADNVRLVVNGSAYPIVDADRRGRTASFQIDGA